MWNKAKVIEHIKMTGWGLLIGAIGMIIALFIVEMVKAV